MARTVLHTQYWTQVAATRRGEHLCYRARPPGLDHNKAALVAYRHVRVSRVARSSQRAVLLASTRAAGPILDAHPAQVARAVSLTAVALIPASFPESLAARYPLVTHEASW